MRKTKNDSYPRQYDKANLTGEDDEQQLRQNSSG
jgi:hypothetical protein